MAPSKIIFYVRTFYTIDTLSVRRKKRGDTRNHSGTLASAPLCPSYHATLIISWSAGSFETCQFQLRIGIVKYHKKKAVGHISSSVFQIQKNVDRLDKLQVNTQTVQSRAVDPKQTKSLDLKVPAFHRHLDADPKSSVGPICTKGWIKTMSKSPCFSSSSLSSEDV